MVRTNEVNPKGSIERQARNKAIGSIRQNVNGQYLNNHPFFGVIHYLNN